MEIIECQQGSEEWFAARLGKVTASCFSDVLCKGTGRKTYMMRLVAERLTGIVQNSYTNAVMERGNEIEPQARVYYEELNECEVNTFVGFWAMNNDVGASPDGVVGDDGLVEIKCPNTTTHIETILKDKMPTKYIPQVQGQMWVMDRKWCDFISFDPRLTQHPFFCIRVFRDEKYIMILSAAVKQFLQELNELIKTVKGR